MKVIETDGIVLKTMDFKENDSILTFLTPEAGKIAGVLHGGKVPAQEILQKQNCL